MARFSGEEDRCVCSMYESGPDTHYVRNFHDFLDNLLNWSAWHGNLTARQIQKSRSCMMHARQTLEWSKKHTIDLDTFHNISILVVSSPMMYFEQLDTHSWRMQGWTPQRTCVSPHDIVTWAGSNTLCCILRDGVPHIGQLDAQDLNHFLLSFGAFSSWLLQQIKSHLTATPWPPLNYERGTKLLLLFLN